MNNQNRGRIGNRLLPASLTELALSLIRERYPDGRKELRLNGAALPYSTYGS